MSQHSPKPGAKGLLARHVTRSEYRAAVAYMENCGNTEGFCQERTSAREEYTPPFDLTGV
jgi:putative pyruvate formate lyase activating enzyme